VCLKLGQGVARDEAAARYFSLAAAGGMV
jgi:hypothetical protein